MISSRKLRRAWQLLPPADREELESLGDLSPLIAQLLRNRGVTSREEAHVFLHPQPMAQHNPLRLPNAEAAVERIASAIEGQETIAIFGDFDADGVTSAALLMEGMRALGARLVPYIPDRVAEGHGLNLPAIHFLREQGVQLIVTADCGITSAGEVAAAADLGIDTVITDHHAPPETLPGAVAVVDPKIPGAPDAYADLAAVGVAFTLMEALYARMGRPTDETLLEYVALGTVADISPMRGENRYLVSQGLDHLNNTKRPGISELLKVSGLAPGQVDTEAISFALGPRINAPGRVEHADPSFQLLVAQSAAEARPLAEMLNAKNIERRQLTENLVAKVEAMLEAMGDALPAILILGDPEFIPGVIGLAAGKLAEQYHRPSIVCQVGPQETRGSCRSIPEFNIIEALRRCDGIFDRYGGHAQAAGFTLPTRDFDGLKTRLIEIASEALREQTLTPSLLIDAELPLEGLNGQAIRALRELAPHGLDNPPPTLLSRNVKVKEARSMGKDGQHTRLKLQAGNVTWSAVAFDFAMEGQPAPPLIDVVYTLSADRWNGGEMLQLRVLDMAPSSEAPRLL